MNSAMPGVKRRKRLALLIPLLLVLTGCMKLDLNIEVHSENDADVAMEIVDTMSLLGIEENGCDEFTDDVQDGEVEEFTDADGNAGCRVSGKIDGTEGDESLSISKDGKELVFKMGNMDLGLGEGEEDFDPDDPMYEMFSPDIAINVTFPGKVTYASEPGKIDGNTVTWTGLEALSSKIEARAEASGGLFGGGGSKEDTEEPADPESDPAEVDETEEPDQGAAAGEDDESGASGEQAAPGAEADADREADSGFPTWLVVVLGLLLLLVLFLIVLVARRQRKDPSPDPQHQQFAGQYADQGQQPQHGQYPYQGQQQPGHYQPQQYPQQGQYPPQGQYPGQQQHPAPGQHPGQQQWDQTQQMPQPGGPWDQTQQLPGQGGAPQQHWDQGQWNQGNNGGRPPQQ